MIKENECCVYIMTNKNNTVLYTGVTSNLYQRILDHRNGIGSKFTKKYNIVKLIYYECGSSIEEAISREKQIKAGSRQNKIKLIRNLNPEWKDLFAELFDH